MTKKTAKKSDDATEAYLIELRKNYEFFEAVTLDMDFNDAEYVSGYMLAHLSYEVSQGVWNDAISKALGALHRRKAEGSIPRELAGKDEVLDMDQDSNDLKADPTVELGKIPVFDAKAVKEESN